MSETTQPDLVAPRVWNKRDPNVPADAIYVGRPTRWGNPWKIGDVTVDKDGRTVRRTRADVIARYRRWITRSAEQRALIKQELRGKHLVCWCAPQACHADVLLEIANESAP